MRCDVIPSSTISNRRIEVSMTRGGSRPNAGRKSVPIDIVELEKLCVLQATNAEIAAWFGCSERTIEKRSKEPELAEVMARGRGRGRVSIRRAQMKLLE